METLLADNGAALRTWLRANTPDIRDGLIAQAPLWALAQIPGAGVRWAQVLAHWEAMLAGGMLMPADARFLEAIRGFAAQESAQ